MKKLLVTGSSGLIGSECVTYFDSRGWSVSGIDNNMRKDFFGPDGDTTWNLRRIQAAQKISGITPWTYATERQL
jgi:CDP-paratose 2-epimerase